MVVTKAVLVTGGWIPEPDGQQHRQLHSRTGSGRELSAVSEGGRFHHVRHSSPRGLCALDVTICDGYCWSQ